jgi:hypothetical protein
VVNASKTIRGRAVQPVDPRDRAARRADITTIMDGGAIATLLLGRGRSVNGRSRPVASEVMVGCGQ